MKIKQVPTDFMVREIGAPKLLPAGQYAIYQLAKEDIGTLEAINALTHSWGISRQQISAGGLKDRHAQTEQLISIRRGPAKDFQNPSFKIKYLGQANEPISPDTFTHNHFIITLRDLSKSEAAKAQERLKQVAQSGWPNYFDEQRFGSVRGGNEFSAKLLIRGDYEGALKIALTATSADDRRSVRELRQTVKEYWGRWRECLAALPRSSERSIINYLKDHPSYFRNAYELMDPKLVRLWLNAYQSFVWNRVVARLIERHLDETNIIHYSYLLGDFLYYQHIPAETLAIFNKMIIPFVTHRTEFQNQPVRLLYEEILKEEGLETWEFRIRGMKQTYFHKGERRMIILPEEMSVKHHEVDELNKGKYKLTLDFKLPRGAYATILIKRLSYDFEKDQ